VEDTATDRGRQLIRIGPIHAEVIQLRDHAYISGNSVAMTSYFSLPKTQRSRLMGRWVVLTPADPRYQGVVTDVSIGSAISDVVPGGQLTRTATTLDGRPVIAVTGSPPASEHPPAGTRAMLLLSQGPQPLPLSETVSAPGRGSETITLSHWGEPVSVSAPQRAIPISAVSHS
jgi:hypothetical protein